MRAFNIRIFINLLERKRKQHDELNKKYESTYDVTIMYLLTDIEQEIQEIKNFMQAYIAAGLDNEEKELLKEWLTEEYEKEMML